MPTPEAHLRETIDELLVAAGWTIQNYKAANLSVASGIALREVPLKATERFKAFSYDELAKRDKANLDIFWLKDEALEESANLPAPSVIVADLEAALEQFSAIEEDLKD